MKQFFGIKRKIFVSLLVILLVVSSLATVIAPAFADAKKATVVSVSSYINNVDSYGSLFRCGTGDYKPLIDSPNTCELLQGSRMSVKIFTKDMVGLPKKEMIYDLIAHNSDKDYICVKKGAIERGYAATVKEIVLSNENVIGDVCTTVNGAGDNKTKAKFTVKEKEDGIYIVFENSGKGDWQGYISDFPYTTEDVPVDFSQIDG